MVSRDFLLFHDVSTNFGVVYIGKLARSEERRVGKEGRSRRPSAILSKEVVQSSIHSCKMKVRCVVVAFVDAGADNLALSVCLAERLAPHAIRQPLVTGVQTSALPIFIAHLSSRTC